MSRRIALRMPFSFPFFLLIVVVMCRNLNVNGKNEKNAFPGGIYGAERNLAPRSAGVHLPAMPPKVHKLYRGHRLIRDAMGNNDLAPFLLMNATGRMMTANTSGKLVMWFTEHRLGTRLSTTDVRKCIQEQLNMALEKRQISVEEFSRLNQLFLDHTAEVGLEHYSATRSVRKDPASKELYRQVVIDKVTDEDTDSD